jgi:hypothetical protein
MCTLLDWCAVELYWFFLLSIWNQNIIYSPTDVLNLTMYIFVDLLC